MLLSGTRGFVVFIGFLLITQFQMLQAHKPRTLAVSPWISATNALEAGHERKARRTLLAALSYPQPRPTALDIPINLTQAERLIDLLPRPLPFGAPSNEYVLANLLMMTRRYDEAAHYAAGSYERDPNTLSALIVARCGAALGDQATAIGWLRSAAQAATSPAGVVTTIDRAPEFAALRNHPEVAAIRELVSATP